MWFTLIILSLATATLLVKATDKGIQDTISCSEFDAKKIKLVTVDVFAAMMDLPTSLTANVAKILPRLNAADSESLANQWMNAYGSYAGVVFDQTVTGASPFQWMLTTSLQDIASKMNLNLSSAEFDALVKAWGDLTPWQGTADVLAKVAAANISIAPLSNGDVGTLKAAMSVFAPNGVSMSYYFSSDFPVGSFKPDPAMYGQVLPTSGLSVNQYLHVAGAPQDGQGARKSGIFSALVYNKPIPGKYAPCFVLKNITDLLTVLGL